MFDFNAYLEEKQSLVESELTGCLPPAGESAALNVSQICDDTPEELYEAMAYSLFAGGKRIRPILCIAAAELFGCSGKYVIRAACALEILHTYSLVHDDLPAMDNDDFRRGRPTNHRVYGEATAILAGDALLTLAFNILSNLDETSVPALKTVGIIRALSRAAGCTGMVGGQSLDIRNEGRKLSLDEMRDIHRRKTGALIEASVEIGGILGDACTDDMIVLKRYGSALGLLFQIVDDILDVVGEKSKMGKTPGKDIAQGKATYPELLGLKGAGLEAEKAAAAAECALDDLSRPAPVLRGFVKYLSERAF